MHGTMAWRGGLSGNIADFSCWWLPRSCQWTRRRTEASSDDLRNWLYLPTVYPADSLISMRPIQAQC